MNMKRPPIIFISLAVLLIVPGCGYRPLYSTSNLQASTVNKLQDIEIPEPTSRREQLIRNEILSSIGSNGRTSGRYRLSFTSKSNSVNTVENFDSNILRKSYRLNVKFTLTDKNTGKVVLNGTTFSHVSYDRTAAPFSDYQALINAREKAAREIGSDISTRLAAFFSTT